MKRSIQERIVALRRKRIFERVSGCTMPLYRFKNGQPRHACFIAEREWIEGATKRRIARQAPVLALALLVLLGCERQEKPEALKAFDAPQLAVAVGPKMASIVTDPAQTTTADRTFRNASFALNLGVPAGLSHDGVTQFRTEYAYLSRAGSESPSSKWMLDLYGLSVTLIPGTQYVDLSLPANREALATAALNRALAVAADGTLFDCPMDVAPGQQWYAVDLMTLVRKKYQAVGLQDWWNTGDGYTWAISDTTQPWGMLHKRAKYQLCQVAVNLSDGRYSFRQSMMSVFTAQARANQGKQVIVGVFDLGGNNGATAQGFFGSTLFSKPNVYGHYNRTYDTKGAVAGQLPTVETSPPDTIIVPPPPPPPPPPVGTVELGLLGDFNGQLVYAPSDNWWNLRVDTAPLDPQSGQIITLLKTSLYEHHYVHLDAMGSWGIPYAVVDASTPLVPVTLGNTSESDKGYPGGPVGYPIPSAAKTNLKYIEAGGSLSGDRHLILYDRDKRAVFELSYAKWDGSRWSAGYGAVFKVDSNYRRTEGWTSTDAAGLCVLAGLIRYDEMYGTEPIRHATRISVKKVGLGFKSADQTTYKGYVWPASHKGSADAGAPPLGMRFRLKASFDINGFTASLSEPHRSAFRRLLTAWKEYGLIVADRGGNMYVQGTLDPRWPTNLNTTFHKLNADNFEIIKLGYKP